MKSTMRNVSESEFFDIIHGQKNMSVNIFTAYVQFEMLRVFQKKNVV